MLYSVLAWGYQKVNRLVPLKLNSSPHVSRLLDNIKQSKPQLFHGDNIRHENFSHFGDYVREQYRLLKLVTCSLNTINNLIPQSNMFSVFVTPDN